MKVLSVKNPWAYLMFHYGKDVENRTHKTNYRGTILIHASKRSFNFGDFVLTMPERFQYLELIAMSIKASATNGCIIGSVRLVDCVQDSRSEWAQPGLWHWVLESPVLFSKPIPATGKLGLWEYNNQLLRA
jgi:hypothetical protein